ncbi:PLC-like phosphodiesterase [Polychaeton citri CBS 116435]|uniref:PLC-like phosphodiesterase n=1 Tax=Polychaeton citri CBS 116435 TaxID=1314669 RepID=A0A9P4Q973_9PEZI|nr:PLC-like phosphodiesterase [Polychaeton citri CBS 116435]
MIYQPGVDKLEHPANLAQYTTPGNPTWTRARYNDSKRRRPQCIAHRGYRAKFPENTMPAFEGAVKAGAHALETDVHITKDKIVVLSHDATLKRCFGRSEKVIDLEYEEIAQHRTTAKPHVPMPRLKDLLEYLAQPGLEEIWLLLDIKLDNDADDIVRLIGETIASVRPSSEQHPWSSRIVLGLWAAKYLPIAVRYLPGFPITHIAFSPSYARHFFDVPNVSFNALFPALIGPGGRKFLQDAQHEHDRQVYAWTVNDVEKMEWSIRRGLDGVCTDDVGMYMDICARFDDYRQERFLPLTPKQYWDVFRIWVWVSIAMLFFRRKLAPVASQTLIQRRAS